MSEENNDEKTYLFAIGLQHLVSKDTKLEDSERRDKDLMLENREIWGDKGDYHSQNRADVTKVGSGQRSVYDWIRGLKYNDHFTSDEGVYAKRGISITLKQLEAKLGNTVHDTMHFLWRNTSTRSNLILTHKTKWDTWSDTLRYVRKLNHNTYSDAAHNDRNNAYILNGETIQTLWEENGDRWLAEKNNRDNYNKELQNFHKCKEIKTNFESDIRQLEKQIEVGEELEPITRDDMIEYFVYRHEGGLTHGLCYDEDNRWRRSKVGEAAMLKADKIGRADTWVRNGMPHYYDRSISIQDIEQAKNFVVAQGGTVTYGGVDYKIDAIISFPEYATLAEKRQTLRVKLRTMLNDYKESVVKETWMGDYGGEEE
jgi:hypothetical protein